MPSASAVQDPEALHPAPPSRACTPLLWALGSALLLVTGSFAAFVAWWVLRAPDSRGATALDAPQLPPDPGARFSDPPQDLFGQLVAKNAQLSTGALSWHSTPGVARVLLARGLRYDAAARELQVAQAGVYYVFVQLALRRVVAGRGAAGSVVATLHLQPAAPAPTPTPTPVPGAHPLALTVDLPPPAASDSAAAFRGVLLHLSAGQRLSLHLRPSEGLSPTWQLDQGATVLGLFCVAPDTAGGLNLQQLT